MEHGDEKEEIVTKKNTNLTKRVLAIQAERHFVDVKA